MSMTHEKPTATLTEFNDIWYKIFLYCLGSNIFFHTIGALVAVRSLHKHRLGRYFAIVIAIVGFLYPITGGLIASCCVAWIYSASRYQMTHWMSVCYGIGQTFLLLFTTHTHILGFLINEMVLRTKKEKKEMVRGAVDIRVKPVWEGPNKAPSFRFSRQFLKAFKTFQVRDTQYIKRKDVQEFLNIFFGDFKKEEDVDSLFLKKFIKRYVTYFTHSKDRWIEMANLHFYLRPFFVPDVFNETRGRLKYSSVDVMQIWTFYNTDHTMSMDDEEVEEFVFDMLSNSKQRFNPKILECVIKKLISLASEPQLTLRGMTNLLPLEASIMKQYDNIQNLNPDDVMRILSFYDQNDEGMIDGCELYALIRDVLEANGHKDPYNMEVILSTQDFLQQEGALSSTGALNFSRTGLLFSLGTNVTSL